MMGQMIYVLLLVSGFGGLLALVETICDFIDRQISRKRRARLRSARHAQADTDMAEWDKLYKAALMERIERALDNDI